MLAINPTPTGIGVVLTTSMDVMNQLYDWVYAILDIDYEKEDGPQNPRDCMSQAFAYEIRHACMDAESEAQQRKIVPCTIKMIWPDAILYIMCLRQKAAYTSLTHEQLALLNKLETELKHAMYEYDPKSAVDNEHLVQPLFDLNSESLFSLQYYMHNEYINTRPRKRAFKNLAAIMHSFLDNFGERRRLIEQENIKGAKKYKCAIRDLRPVEEYLKVKRW